MDKFSGAFSRDLLVNASGYQATFQFSAVIPYVTALASFLARFNGGTQKALFRGGTNALQARFRPHPLRICGSLPPNSLTRKGK
ncbi:hypothetical protein FXV83_29120 [Bradyrhizobium hipponense]|uniref:Uncharacterized protein n=1 Tax=Bradyrhizobium hipponense TaxID=2605638 RepID=A0A5S4YS21_9BRAD|nr:hypothetical protein [Bradyrhizobium hipponense]TYO63119.1 hypothetical protein FXV83_29120 [Bradyrhizobium hipponense]